MSMSCLERLDAPCVLLNLDGYYDGLKALLGTMVEKGLSTPERQQGIRFAGSVAELAKLLG